MDHKKFKSHFQEFLRSKRKNITPERMDILAEVLKQESHFKIDDIIGKMAEAKKPVSRATVYRTIKTIEEAGLIKYIHSINDEKFYEVEEDHHDHMICEICGKFIEFHNDELEALQTSICKSKGFKPSRHTMKIFGVCKNCDQ